MVSSCKTEMERRQPGVDIIEAPGHYTFGSKECIEYIHDIGAEPGYLLGSAVKYIFRHQHKQNPIGDIQKAIKCLQMYLETFKDND